MNPCTAIQRWGRLTPGSALLWIGMTSLAGCIKGGDATRPDPDIAVPTVQISPPRAGSVNTTSFAVAGTASDAVRVSRVTYRLNGAAEQSVVITPGTSVSAFPLPSRQA